MQMKSYFRLFICIIHIKAFFFLRKIAMGERSLGGRSYLAYFLKSNMSSNNYDAWLCGGAIVSPSQILTSAACLKEMNHLYAIAGYRRYVNAYDIEEDACTKTRKQKVVKVYLPKEYVFEHSNFSQWMNIDIGVAVVEKPYDFSDLTWRIECSYVPAPIYINYEPSFQRPGTEAVACGWGTKQMRQKSDLVDRNSEFLREASMVIITTSACLKENKNKALVDFINNNKYLICGNNGGRLDSLGMLRNSTVVPYDGCGPKQLRAGDNQNCEDDYYYDEYDFRRKDDTGRIKNVTKSRNRFQKTKLKHFSRRQRSAAVCQNDHGGPLVTWVGNRQMVIGVAIGSQIESKTLRCIPPSFFVSTSCASKIIHCLLTSKDSERNECKESSAVVVREDWVGFHG